MLSSSWDMLAYFVLWSYHEKFLRHSERSVTMRSMSPHVSSYLPVLPLMQHDYPRFKVSWYRFTRVPSKAVPPVNC